MIHGLPFYGPSFLPYIIANFWQIPKSTKEQKKNKYCIAISEFSKSMGGAQKFFVVAVLLLAIASNGGFFRVSDAQTICNVPLSGLMACKPSVTPPNPTKPTAACCSALSHADMRCLCSYKNSSVLPSLGIDPTLALQLPQKCNLPHPANC